MAFYYALSRPDAESRFHVYGKGDDATAAEAEAASTMALHESVAESLRANLVVATREDAEGRGLIPRGASVVWYERLKRYNEEGQSGRDEIGRLEPS